MWECPPSFPVTAIAESSRSAGRAHYSAIHLSPAALKGLEGCLLDLTKDPKSYISCFCLVKGSLKNTQRSAGPSTQNSLPATRRSTQHQQFGAQRAALVSSKAAYVRPGLSLSRLPATGPTAGGTSLPCQLSGITVQDNIQIHTGIPLKVSVSLQRKNKNKQNLKL